MQTNQKNQIKAKLSEYCEIAGRQNKAANKLRGVSSATISQILNDNWELIKDEMWMNVGKQIGYSSKNWNVVETRNYKFLTNLLKGASNNSDVLAVIDNAGSGKSCTTKLYDEKNKRVYRIECKEYWNRKDFLRVLLHALGGNANGMNVNEMVDEIVKILKQQQNPLIILDEFDKVNDIVLYFFITLYNELEDECGILVCSTDHLQKRVTRGLKLNKKGYQEFFSRIGGKFIKLPGVCATDIEAICFANGITKAADVKSIIEDSELDLRRVKRKISAFKMRA